MVDAKIRTLKASSTGLERNATLEVVELFKQSESRREH
jgi:hypothetical protein